MGIKETRCFNCNKSLKQKKIWGLYSLVVITNTSTHFIGLVKLLEELDGWLMKQYLHLSSSQIVLLRPDILEEYLQLKLTPEMPIFWFLNEHPVCDECYRPYIKLVPVR